jgi:hypothetical protein
MGKICLSNIFDSDKFTCPHTQQVSLYMDKFSGVCQSVLHECKLTFLQIISDHDLFVEMPGRDPSDRNYLSSILIQELFLSLDHDELPLRAKVYVIQSVCT